MGEEYFLTRRSCRQFKPEKISDNLLKSILERAMKAPTCGNMQLYTVVVTRDEERKKKLSCYHYNQPASETAPVILTICADFNRFTRWCKINEADAGFDNFHSFLTAMTDAVIYSQQIVTIAESEGLGTCYLGTVTYNAKEISELLKLPKLVVPVASLAIGFPLQEGDYTDRLPIEAIVHEETYRNDGDEKIVELFEIHDKNSENEKFIRENGKNNLAQVFSEIRYPRSVNEEISKTFKELLKEKGF